MVSASLLIAIPLMPDAYSAPTTEPALVPHTRSTWMSRASSALITPMCAKPRAAPPPSASPTRMTRSRVAAAGRVVGAKGAATPPVLLLVDAQAVRTADAQASENVRRVRRGDEGFKRFLQRQREPGWA